MGKIIDQNLYKKYEWPRACENIRINKRKQIKVVISYKSNSMASVDKEVRQPNFIRDHKVVHTLWRSEGSFKTYELVILPLATKNENIDPQNNL